MTFDNEFFNIGYLDRLSYRDTVVHRLDPRSKVIVTMLYVLTVVSYPKYDVTSLMPLFLYPILLSALSDTPFLLIAKKVLIVSPFAVFIGIFNPFFDTGTIDLWRGIQISAGWISLLSIMIKFTLTISAALLLIATTSFPGICHALQELGIPALFTSQLLFLYRYIFVLMEEAMRMVRARDLRTFGARNIGITVFVRLIGLLFIRTVERAERIYQAMLFRGFHGKIFSIKQHSLRPADTAFISLSVIVLVVLRLFNLTDLIGRFVQGILL